MIPTALEDWSLQALEELLARRVFEDEQFDFKAELPHTKDNTAKVRLRKTCCAFANSGGGFLVFGIADAKGLKPSDRLVGIDGTFDFPEHFGNYPLSCSPSVSWSFLNPPLKLENGRLVHVVHVPKSWRAPHAVGDTEAGWGFAKRTNKGNESMNMDEVRSAFLGFYEKRLKLQLLRSELSAIKQNGLDCFVADSSTSYSLVSFDTTILDSIVTDTYSITADYSDLLTALFRIRELARRANNKVQMFSHVAMIGMTNKENMVKEHNGFLQAIGEEIAGQCDFAADELEKILTPSKLTNGST